MPAIDESRVGYGILTVLAIGIFLYVSIDLGSGLLSDWKTYEFHVWNVIMRGPEAIIVASASLIGNALLILAGFRSLYREARRK
jgi:hypothetical protein